MTTSRLDAHGRPDTLYDRLFSHPLMVKGLIREFVPEAKATGLDFSRMQRVNAKFTSIFAFRLPSKASDLPLLLTYAERQPMRIRPLLSAAVIALVTMQAIPASTARAAASVSGAADAAEAAYVEALRAANKAEVAKKEAEVALEREKTTCRDRAAEIQARRAAAIGGLDQRVQQAEEALEVLKKTPSPIVEAMTAYEKELATAQATRKPYLDAADAAQKTLVGARSRLSVARAAVERARARIGAAKSGIADEEARIGRIQAGDQAELDGLAKIAVEEKETVAALLRDFAPAYMAAKSTARIAVGLHLPAMYKVKQAIEAVKSGFCGDYTADAKRHIEYAVMGIESFLHEPGAIASTFIDLADKALPKETDAVCHLHLAEIGIEDAGLRIAGAKRRIAEDEAEIAADEAVIRDAEKAVADAQAMIAEKERSAAGARAALDAVERRGAAARSGWEAELKTKKEERARQEAELAAHLGTVRAERDAAAAPFEALLRSLQEPQDAVVTAASDTANTVSREAGQKKEAFLAALLRQEMLSGVAVHAAARNKYGIDTEICVSFSNRGRFAVTKVWGELTADGKALPAGIDVPLSFSGYDYSSKKVRVSQKYNDTGLTFSTSNRYSETIPYLMPGASSTETCASMLPLFKGDNLRKLEAMGLGEHTLSRFGLVLTSFEVADPAAEKRLGGGITLSPLKLDDVYRSRLERAKAVAAASVTSTAATSAAPAATAQVAPDAPAKLAGVDAVRVQQALIDSGYLTGKPDGKFGLRSREAIHRWQAANGHRATGELTVGQLHLLIRQ